MAGLTGAGVVGAPAAQARPHSGTIDVTRLTPTYAKVKVICPDDPPARIYLSGTVDGVGRMLAITEPFVCTEHPQTFRLALTSPLASGTVVEDAKITFSGDSGEIIGFLGTVVVR